MKRASGFKLYAVIVGAILMCVILIGALLVNTRQHHVHTAPATTNHYDVKSHEDRVFYLAEQIPGGFDLYYDYYMHLTSDTSEEEKKAKLDEIEVKLRQMQQAQRNQEAARPQQLQPTPTP